VDAVVFRKVRAIDPACGLDALVDVVVEGGRITRLGPEAAKGVEGERVWEVGREGAWLLPGLVDLHAHLREPGQEYKEDIASGLAAAAAGGFTDVCAMPNTSPVNDSPAVTELMLERARTVGGPRLHPLSAITVGQRGDALCDLRAQRDAGVIAMSDDGRCVTRSDVMMSALVAARDLDIPLVQHAEDHALTAGAVMHEGAVSARLGLRGWPRVAEDVIVARDLILASYTRSRYHLAHVSTRGAVELVREAKSRGLPVTCEVTPHHLLLTDAALLGYDPLCRVNPPLREDDDVAALRAGLADGTIDCIATDHAPHSASDKGYRSEATRASKEALLAAAPGMVGLELCLPLLLELAATGTLPIARVIAALTSGPAGVVGMEGRGLYEGARADLVVLDADARRTVDRSALRSKSNNTPFEGREIRGRVIVTMVGGRVVFDESARAEKNR